MEAEAAQLDVNSPFALFYPEKRPFFLEGGDIFGTRLNAIWSRNPAVYETEVDARSQSWFNQLLLSYKINPQTVLFLGYSDTSIGDRQIELTRESRTVFLKIGYAWML